MRRLLTLAAACVLVAGCGRSPLPVKPGGHPSNVAPACTPSEEKTVRKGNGQLGVCTPQTPARAGGLVSAPTGPDVSNNDPIMIWAPVRGAGHPFAYVKLSQGAGFVDGTARFQMAQIHRSGIHGGGYDFAEVCAVPVQSETSLFLNRRKATGSVGLPPVLDAEWPLSPPCSVAQARTWVSSWIRIVARATDRSPVIYTGAWWWNPNLGCWWPHGVRLWLAGYSTSLPEGPCSAPKPVLWQYTDNGWNGASFTDMSRLFVPLSTLLPGRYTDWPAIYRLRKLEARYHCGRTHTHQCAVWQREKERLRR